LVGDLAGFQHDRIGGQRSSPQRCGDAGHDVLVTHAPVQQQDLDQRTGSLGFTVGRDRGGPPGVVRGREPAGCPGLLQRGGVGERAGLAGEHLQVMVQVQASAALGHQPLVGGHRSAAVVSGAAAAAGGLG
jgi:hypothetical protein